MAPIKATCPEIILRCPDATTESSSHTKITAKITENQKPNCLIYREQHNSLSLSEGRETQDTKTKSRKLPSIEMTMGLG